MTTATATDARATTAQFARLRRGFAARKGNPLAEEIRVALNSVMQAGLLTKKMASETISALESIPVNPSAAPAAPVLRANTYPGACKVCTKTVGAGEGVRFHDSESGKWVVAHRAGECPVIEFPFVDGSYAIEVDGEIRLYTCREGTVYARRSDDEVELTNLDNARQVVDQIALDYKAAAVLFGHTISYCGFCGKSLTDRTGRSQRAGVGPVCAKKHNIDW